MEKEFSEVRVHSNSSSPMRKAIRRSSSGDHISNLSNDTLSSILSSLSMRDAARTSVLSKRWRDVWIYNRSINLDIDEVLGITPCHIGFRLSATGPSIDERVDDFPRLVDQCLERNLGLSIKSFSLHLCSSKHYNHVKNWINLAISEHVEKLDLDFSNATTEYHLPHDLFTDGRGFRLKHLSLRNCHLQTPVGFDGFNSLKSLSLEEVTFSENLISCCPLLEKLSLQSCKGLDNLIIGYPPIQLKYLKVLDCGPRLEVYAKNLVEFQCSGFKEAYLYLSIDRDDTYYPLVPDKEIFKLESLQTRRIFTPDPLLGGFKSLKVLSLVGVNFTPEFLEGLLSNCSFLEQFTLEKCNMRLPKFILEISGLVHLKDLKICKCLGFKNARVCATTLRKFVFISENLKCDPRDTFELLDNEGNKFSPVLGKTSALEHLHLEGSQFAVDQSNFSSLTTIIMEKMHVKEEHIRDMLSNCTFLERLSITECYGLFNLNIVAKFLQFKHLSVNKCKQLKGIEIFARDLTTFKYHGPPVCFSFKEVPRLVTVDMKIEGDCARNHMDHPLLSLACDVPQLRTLLFHTEDEEIPQSLPEFSNLKQLTLFMSHGMRVTDEISWATLFLMHSPFLEKFQLQFSRYFLDNAGEATLPTQTFINHHLKEVELSNFRCIGKEIEFAVSLLRNAPSLQLMTVGPRAKFPSDWDQSDRKQTLQLLSEKVPMGVQLVVR